ncbi:hypothetical protein B296_00022331, partial [Ensete ventricosum]
PAVPAGVAPCGLALAVGGRPYMEAGRGWPLLLLVAFATKTQQERVERFYVKFAHTLSGGHRVRGEGLGPVRVVAFMSCILDVEKRVRCNVFKANANYVFESNKKAKTCKLSLNKFGIRGA